eukprot:3958900-Pyramimonas_sp.AAC.2
MAARRKADALFAKRMVVLLAIVASFWLVIMRYEERATALFGPEFVAKMQSIFISIGIRFDDGLKRGIWEKLSNAGQKLTAGF